MDSNGSKSHTTSKVIRKLAEWLCVEEHAHAKDWHTPPPELIPVEVTAKLDRYIYTHGYCQDCSALAARIMRRVVYE